MTDRDPASNHSDDLPWDDVPADSDVTSLMAEPDPAEVVGDEGQEVDISHRSAPDAYHRDTLDERLAEEVPDQAVLAEDSAAGELQAPESGADDVAVDRAEPDQVEPADADELPAEEAAIHIVDPPPGG